MHEIGHIVLYKDDGVDLLPQIEQGRKDGVEYNEEQYARSAEYLRTIVKALIGRDLFEQSTYYRVANPMNPVYREAIRMISDGDAYDAALGNR